MRSLFYSALAIAVNIGAHAAVLTFSGNICSLNSDGSGAMGSCISNGAYVSQQYGDTADVDLTYSVAGGPFTFQTWIDPNVYSNLSGVGYGFFGGTPPTASITFIPTAGKQVTLSSLLLGTDPPNVTRSTTVDVIDLATNTTVFTTTLNVGAVAPTVSPNVTSAVGLRLVYGNDVFNVALDDVTYSTSDVPSTGGVPEPSTILLSAAGLLAATRLRRRA